MIALVLSISQILITSDSDRGPTLHLTMKPSLFSEHDDANGVALLADGCLEGEREVVANNGVCRQC